MAKIRLLFGAAQALALLGLVLVLFALVIGFGESAGPLGQALGDALRLALMVRGSFRLGLGLGFGSLLCLFALNLGILGSVPGL